MCQGLFFNKVADVRLATLLKRRLCRNCFPMNFAKILRTPIFKEHLRWLLPTSVLEQRTACSRLTIKTEERC